MSNQCNKEGSIMTPAQPTEAMQAIEAARQFIESEYRDPAAEEHGEWLAAEARPVHAQLCNALAMIAASPPTGELPSDALVERDLRATHYARCLQQVSTALSLTVDELEDEGGRVFLGHTNHADLLREAWGYLDDLEVEELLADTQPATDLVKTNLELQARITEDAKLIADTKQALEAVKACEKTALNGRFVNLAHLRKAMPLVDAALQSLGERKENTS